MREHEWREGERRGGVDGVIWETIEERRREGEELLLMSKNRTSSVRCSCCTQEKRGPFG